MMHGPINISKLYNYNTLTGAQYVICGSVRSIENWLNTNTVSHYWSRHAYVHSTIKQKYIYIDTYKEQKTNTTKTAQNSDQHQLEQQRSRGKDTDIPTKQGTCV